MKKQVLTKFDSLKVNTGSQTMMSPDAIDSSTTNSKLVKFSSSRNVIRTHRCIFTAIYFESTKFCHKLLQI